MHPRARPTAHAARTRLHRGEAATGRPTLHHHAPLPPAAARRGAIRRLSRPTALRFAANSAPRRTTAPCRQRLATILRCTLHAGDSQTGPHTPLAPRGTRKPFPEAPPARRYAPHSSRVLSVRSTILPAMAPLHAATRPQCRRIRAGVHRSGRRRRPSAVALCIPRGYNQASFLGASYLIITCACRDRARRGRRRRRLLGLRRCGRQTDGRQSRHNDAQRRLLKPPPPPFA